MVPPLFYKSGKAGGLVGRAVPAAVRRATGRTAAHFVLFPLFWRFRDEQGRRHSTVVLNYLHRRHGGETTDALFPLLYWRRGASPGGQPETSFTLFPLVHYKRTADRRLFVSPIAFASRSPDRKAGFIPPYFWYQSKDTSASGVPPLYFDFTRLDTQERTRIFGPWVAIDSPKSRRPRAVPAVRPLPGRQATRAPGCSPATSTARTTDGYALDTLFPLFWYSPSPGHSTTVVGPWYRRAGPEKHTTGFVPLYFYARNQERRFILTPLFYERQNFKDGTGKLFAALLFYRTTRPDGHTTVGFPLYWGAGATGRAATTCCSRWSGTSATTRRRAASTWSGPLYWSSHKDGKERTRGHPAAGLVLARRRASAPPRTPSCRCSTRSTAPASSPC